MPPQRNELRRRRSSSVTVRRIEIVVPDPSSSGRFSVASVSSTEVSGPGPIIRWVVLALIGFGVAGMVGYAWVRSNENPGLSENAIGGMRAAPPMQTSLGRDIPTS